MGLGESLMKIVVKVRDAVELARRFETSPRETLREVVEQVRSGVRHTLEEVMDAEIELFLGLDRFRQALAAANFSDIYYKASDMDALAFNDTSVGTPLPDRGTHSW